MTTLTQVRETPARVDRVRRRLRGPPVGVLIAVGVVVALRLPFIGGPLAADEAGYLAVAQQWHTGGSSLYGDYWVDRPPMLITIFRIASLLGGTVPLRLIGVAAAVVTLLAVGRAAGLLAGRRAATWAALVAAAFLVSPLTGASEVDGELLAAPFIAVGIVGLIEALTSASPRRAAITSWLAGACGVAAVLVKQNMLDVFVFGGVLVLLSARTVGLARVRRVVGAFAGGGLLTTGLMAWWTLAHGTSLSGVWFAMYRFRIEADRLMAAFPSASSALRESSLCLAAASSGMVLVAGLLVVAVIRREHNQSSSDRTSQVARAIPLALLATVGYDAVSIYLGGSFWVHYLVQLAVPLALAAGLAVVSQPRLARPVAGLVAVSAAVAVTFSGLHPMSDAGTVLGDAIGAVSQPTDTIITVWGHSEVTRSSRLKSPYPYLWYLPERTLDPQLSLLDATLQGAHAPTWFVSCSGTGLGLRGVDTSTLTTLLAKNYHRVGDLNGSVVYLHDGVHRAVPVLTTATGT
jgi:hypothetical protein